jgi:2-dehydro-3-deoxyphosphogalactonate aldolase
MERIETFRALFEDCPLIAIIRGVEPGEVEAIGEALVEAGIRIIEVPLNSPQPLDSIARLARRLRGRALVGAGTVLRVADVAEVEAAGGGIIVSPSTDQEVIRATVRAGLVSAPGYFTPSEAFMAIEAGAHALKLFPAEAATPAVLKAQLAVLPKGVPMIAVGGIEPDNMQPWLAAGASGFGLGGGLYQPGQTAEQTLDKARAYVAGVRS